VRPDSIISLTARIQHWCVLRYFGLDKIKKNKLVRHFDNESKITGKKIPVSTRTLEDITIKYLRWIRIVAKKATISFIIFVC
jgi:hypothetical protein